MLLKRSIASTESGLPLVTFVDSDKMVCILEVDFGEELGFPRTIQEVGDVGKWVTVFLHDLVEVLIINTESKEAILFLDE